MNIFVLDQHPVKAASMQCDKHVVKMVLETAQILSTVARNNGIDHGYRPTHAKHPCTIWAGESLANWEWLVQHGLGLAIEYTARYGKEHKSAEIIRNFINLVPDLPDIGLTPFAQAMPDEYKCEDAVEAYRQYYLNEKKDIAEWSCNNAPMWFLERVAL